MQETLPNVTPVCLLATKATTASLTIPLSSSTSTASCSYITPSCPLPPPPTTPTYYVATNGSDQGAGTLESPFQTLQHAIAQIADNGGGTIYLRDGIYQPNQGVWIGKETDGSAYSPLVIRPYQNEKVIIDGSLMSSSSYGIGIGGNYVDIIGLEVRNMQGGGILITNTANVQILNNTVHNIQLSGIGAYGSSSSISDRNSNIRIDGNTVYRTYLLKGANRDNADVNWGMGISVGFSDNVIVTNNKVYENYGEGIGLYVSTNGLVARNVVYDNYALGVYLDNASNIVVDENFIYNTGNPEFFRNGVPSNGIQMANETYSLMGYDQSPYYLNNNRIQNNIVIGGRTGIYYGTYTGFGNGDGQNLYGMRNTAIVNNTFYNPNLFIEIDEDPNIANVSIANNIFARTFSNGLLADIPNTTTIAVEYNLWWDGNQNGSNQTILTSTNLFTDPKLINPGSFNAADYQLSAGSPAINAGSYQPSVSTDYFGETRPVDSLYDIGADEWQLVSL